MEDDNKKGEVIIPERIDISVKKPQSLAYHEESVRQHYSGKTLTEMIDEDDLSTEDLMRFLMREFAKEVDSLAGNQVIALKNGDNEGSAVISVKRSEIVEKYLKAIMTKKEFEATTSIDVESPSMRIIFQYFLEKCQESFNKAGMNAEISDVFFRNFMEICGNTWKKDLKKRIAEIKA